MTFGDAHDVHGVVGGVFGAVGRCNDDRACAVGFEAAVENAERFGYVGGREVVVHR